MMQRITWLLVAVATVAGGIAATAPVGRLVVRPPDLREIKVFPGYRDWKLISVAHEEGNLNDIRAILGNDIAIKAYREEKFPFPDGTVIARIAWKDSSRRRKTTKSLAGAQSFVAGPAPGLVLAVHGQGLTKIRCNGWLGVRSV